MLHVLLLSVLGTSPYHKFIIPIKTEEYEPETENGLTCKLKFEYTSKYPEEAPEVEICEAENFEEEDEALLKEHIVQEVSCIIADISGSFGNLGVE